MSCGCSAQQALVNETALMVNPQYQALDRTYQECDYTKEQCAIWLEKVNCVKDNGYYVDIPNITTLQLNLYIGVLVSVQNYKGSPCYFKAELEEIESFITVITSMNLCLTS